MYHAQLSNRYLGTRIIPLIAVAAVALCVALVIIVVSVMSGFLDMLKQSGRALMGDVVVSYPLRGIPHYPELLRRIKEIPGVEAATPLIETWGLLRMPYPDGDQKEIATVQVWGVEPESFSTVTGFDGTLWWRPPMDSALDSLADDDLRRAATEQMLEDGESLLQSETGKPGMVLGIHVALVNQRQRDGSYRPVAQRWWMPRQSVALTLVPVSGAGRIAEPKEVIFPVVNEFFSGVYQIDKQRVMIPLAEAQSMLRMSEATLTNPQVLDEDGRPVVLGVDPAKVTKILVRATPGSDVTALRDAVARSYAEFDEALLADPEALVKAPPPQFVSVLTWEQVLRDLIAPVEKEREMMRILFSIIYLVCAGLVFSIFWAIVYEKTRDIGILRSLGAPRSGIIWLFLRYGVVIGSIGSLIGLLLAWLVVRNINAIHEAIGEDAPRWSWLACYVGAGLAVGSAIVAGARQKLLAMLLWSIGAAALALVATGLLLHRGMLIWDPSVYYFTRIPSKVDGFTAVLTMIGAVVFSVLGASIPAAKAADTDPVRALRYE
jgi:lipoprotein-releasing system permease protein